MFLQGDVVKRATRTNNNDLFLLVIFDPQISLSMFKAVVIKDFSGIDDSGLLANNWNTENFKLSSWDDFFTSNLPASLPA